MPRPARGFLDTVTGRQIYRCGFCDGPFEQSGDAAKHQQICHVKMQRREPNRSDMEEMYARAANYDRIAAPIAVLQTPMMNNQFQDQSLDVNDPRNAYLVQDTIDAALLEADQVAMERAAIESALVEAQARQAMSDSQVRGNLLSVVPYYGPGFL